MLAYALALVLGAPGAAADGEGSGRASDPDRPFIRCTLRRGETVEELAARYDVTLDEIMASNGQTEFHRGDVVRIQPRKFAPPRAFRTVKSSERRTWEEIAADYDVSVEELKGWNPQLARRKSIAEGVSLTLWLDSGVTRFPYADGQQPLPSYEVTPGGYSIGKPHRGRIENAVQLPESDLYTIRFDRLAYGSSLTVRSIQQAVAGFRRDSGFTGELFIGAMSRRTGRKLRPHRSHQSGRDLDIRMPAMSDAEGFKLDKHEVDWHALWVLVDSFVRTKQVSVIFLERKFHDRLRRAGMRMGATDERIEEVMARVRHAKGHTSHIHVRFKCAPEAEQCVETTPDPDDPTAPFDPV